MNKKLFAEKLKKILKEKNLKNGFNTYEKKYIKKLSNLFKDENVLDKFENIKNKVDRWLNGNEVVRSFYGDAIVYFLLNPSRNKDTQLHRTYIDPSKEILDNIIEMISIFNELKSKNRTHGLDLFSIKSFEDFVKEVEYIQKSKSITQKKKEIKDSGSELLWKNKDISVYKITSYEASCKLGHDTKWCVSMKNKENYWNEYEKEGKEIFFIINNTKGLHPNYKKIGISIFPKEKNESYNNDNFEAYDMKDNLVAFYRFINIMDDWKVPLLDIINQNRKNND
jgi:hypothetical protein